MLDVQHLKGLVWR